VLYLQGLKLSSHSIEILLKLFIIRVIFKLFVDVFFFLQVNTTLNQVFVLHFVKVRFELAEAFIEDTSHTNKHITDLLIKSCTDRRFELRFQSSYDSFCVPLVLLIQIYESILNFQYFSHNNLNYILELVVLTLNNVVLSENLNNSIMHINNSLSNSLFCLGNFECADILEFGHPLYLILVGLQECKVRLDKGPSEVLRNDERVHLYI
jgi:hypothetical protein